MTGSGSLAVVEFEVLGAPGSASALHIGNAVLNGGAIGSQNTDGTFQVSQVYRVSGLVRYWNGGGGVSGTDLALNGDRSYSAATAADGSYTVSGASAGAYSLIPSKSNGAGSITAYDASLVLQHAVGLTTLAGHASVAADVDRSGAINAMDAFYILQQAVGLIALPFPGAGRVWWFDPLSRSYAALGADQAAQDFTAILLGDVSGNWTDPAPGGGGAATTSPAGTSADADAAGAPTGGGSSATLYLPRVVMTPGVSRTLPVTLKVDGADVYSVDLVLRYDPTVVSVSAVSLGAAAGGAMIASNLETPGTVRVAVANATPLGAGGELLTVNLSAVGSLGTSTTLTVDTLQADEGAVTAATQAGSVGIVGSSLSFTNTLFPYATQVKAVHLEELRQSIQTLRDRYSLPAVWWTDPYLVARVTTVKAAHLTELRSALTEVYTAAGLPPPGWTPVTVTRWMTVITAAQIAEVRRRPPRSGRTQAEKSRVESQESNVKRQESVESQQSNVDSRAWLALDS